MRNNRFQDKIRSFMYENSRKKDSRPYYKKEPNFFSDVISVLEEIDDYIDEKIKEFEYSMKHKKR